MARWGGHAHPAMQVPSPSVREAASMYGTAVAVFLVILVAALQGSAPAESPFPFHIPLDPEGTLELSWNVSYAQETIYFQLLVRELKAGILFGMSDRGELENADLVVLWTDGDGAYFGVSPTPTPAPPPLPLSALPDPAKEVSLLPLWSVVSEHPCVPSLGISDADVSSRWATGGFPDGPARPRSAAQDGGLAHHIKQPLHTSPSPSGGRPPPPDRHKQRAELTHTRVWGLACPTWGVVPAPWVTRAPGLEGTICPEVHTSLHTPNSPSVPAGKGGGQGGLPSEERGLGALDRLQRGPPGGESPAILP